MNDSLNYARFKPCIDLIVERHPVPVKFTSLSNFTPNSYCTLLRRAKHYHVQVLNLPFPDGVNFRYGHDHVVVGLPKSALEPLLPTGSSELVSIPRPLTEAEFDALCSLIDRGVFGTHTFRIPGRPPGLVHEDYGNVEMSQQSDHYILL